MLFVWHLRVKFNFVIATNHYFMLVLETIELTAEHLQIAFFGILSKVTSMDKYVATRFENVHQFHFTMSV
jgi:hypothetical protein